MFSTISASIVQAFTALTLLFSMFAKLAKAGDNVASVLEQTSQSYLDEAINSREVQLIALKKTLAITDTK